MQLRYYCVVFPPQVSEKNSAWWMKDKFESKKEKRRQPKYRDTGEIIKRRRSDWKNQQDQWIIIAKEILTALSKWTDCNSKDLLIPSNTQLHLTVLMGCKQKDSILQNGKAAPGLTRSPIGSSSAPSHQFEMTKSTFFVGCRSFFSCLCPDLLCLFA